MGRKIVEGLQYFPFDIDFWDDPKILMIEEKFGIKGSSIAARLLCWIYRNGYYINWNNDMALVFAKRVGNQVTCALVSEVVNELVNLSFFHKGLFERFAILTSNGIQKRWIEIISKSKRKANIIAEYEINSCFGVISSEEMQSIPELIQAIPDGSTQSKVKESKGKRIEELKIEDCKRPVESIDYQIILTAIKLYKGFRAALPNNLDLPRTLLIDWIPPIRELMAEKKYSYPQIIEILDFALKEKFWSTVIMDTASLARNFEKLKNVHLKKINQYEHN